MAYATGTATGHIDLLDKLITFLTTNAELVAAGQNWETKLYQEVPADAGQYEVILRGPGLADDDDIYVGIQTYQSVASDYYNWTLAGYTGYDAELTFTTQPGNYNAYGYPRVYLTNGSIKYWFVANGRRFVVVAKVSTVYQSCYMGLITPYYPNTLLPYPLFIAGCGITAALRWSSTEYYNLHGILYPTSSQTSEANALLYPTASARFYDGEWVGLQHVYGAPPTNMTYVRGIWPRGGYSLFSHNYLRSNYDDSYTLFPLIPFSQTPEGKVWGELDGCYAVSGFNNAPENIIRINGYDHLVVQNVHHTTISNYWALKICETATTTTTTSSSSTTTTTTAP